MFRRNFALVALLASSALLHAQVVGGTISGTVTDQTGAVIPNVVVVVHNQDTGTQRTLTTNASGSYLSLIHILGIEHEAIDGAYDVTIFEDLGNGQTKLDVYKRQSPVRGLWPPCQRRPNHRPLFCCASR